MLTVNEAFTKFKNRLEITPTEQAAASRRHTTIREQVASSINVSTSFLTGSYVRATKTKPLKDVDVFVVLRDDESDYLDKPPDDVLAAIEKILLQHYPSHRVTKARRSVRVDFGVKIVDDIANDVVSIDVVPAFQSGAGYTIPDTFVSEWILTNPKIHAEKATAANKAFSGCWVPAVKMIKKWNAYNDKPVRPSFLLEVMALDLLDGSWTGSYPQELRQFFASAADRIGDGWDDPAHLGPPVSDRIDSDLAALSRARTALETAERVCTEALRQQREGRTGAALDQWQQLFGPLFAKS